MRLAALPSIFLLLLFACKRSQPTAITQLPDRNYPYATRQETTTLTKKDQTLTMSILQEPLMRSVTFLDKLKKQCHCNVTGIFLPSFDKDEPVNYSVSLPLSAAPVSPSYLKQCGESLYNSIRAKVLRANAVNFNKVIISYDFKQKSTPFEFQVNPIKTASYTY